MANLHGHEAGNGGYSQGDPTGIFGTAPFFRIAGVALAAMSGAIGVAIGLLP